MTIPTLNVSILVILMTFTCVVVAAPDFEALGRDAVSELASGAFDKVVERFDLKMAAELPREKLAEAWETIVGQAGPFKAVTSVRVEPVPAQGVHLVVLTTTFEKTPLDIQIAFNDEGKITGLFLVVKPQAAAWANDLLIS